MQYWTAGNPDPKCPFLTIYLYKLYLAAEYMRKEYDNLHSHIEASETRITKELRDKAEVQAQEASAMDEGY
jgi:hypothetical protein